MAHESPELRDEHVTKKQGTKSGEHPGGGQEEALGD